MLLRGGIGGFALHRAGTELIGDIEEHLVDRNAGPQAESKKCIGASGSRLGIIEYPLPGTEWLCSAESRGILHPAVHSLYHQLGHSRPPALCQLAPHSLPAAHQPVRIPPAAAVTSGCATHRTTASSGRTDEPRGRARTTSADPSRRIPENRCCRTIVSGCSATDAQRNCHVVGPPTCVR
jgi:hypothetical protein